MVAQTRTWTKPELIVLVRGKPDEAVLAFCKEGTGGSGSAGNTNNACLRPSGTCDVCQSTDTS